MMNKKSGAVVNAPGRLSAALVLAFVLTGSTAQAAYFDAAYSISEEAQVAETSFTLTGVVMAVHYSQNTIELQSGGARVTIHVTPTTSIARKGETGSIADIRQNQKLTITGVMRNGERIAVSIAIN
jgi:cytochrome c-type biogenesis protein CcmE